MYSRSINGSIFEGLNKDFVSVAVMHLLSSKSSNYLHRGNNLVLLDEEHFCSASKTIYSISNMDKEVDRLIQKLSWTTCQEKRVHLEAAKIVLNLVNADKRCLRDEGSLHSISSFSVWSSAASPASAAPSSKGIFVRRIVEH
eukprot:TRINITY_DN6746_c0_g2_i4.p1 TRINITY_DN6746_c0_g2~~TRINITY_DN6746_c0_g2_i4.p1  ORF type:complete len:142 (-),score=17.25 TRINITY_DN6746_c0_g2_i4:3-428(-)